MALHVGGGVPFGVALLLGLPERRAEGEPRPDHPRENIIGGAVENAVDFQNLIGSQALAQGPDDGDAAPHAGLKEIANALLPRQLGELIAAGGHQLLIRGDHALASLQRPSGEVQGDGRPADGLHHDIHLGVVLNDGKVLHKAVCKGAVREVPHIQNILQPDQSARLALDAVLVPGEHLRHAGAHGPKS